MANPNPPLDQPDPWEPDRATCEAVQELTERLTRTVTDREAGESFTECLVCGEVDSHGESCIVPSLKSWLEGSDSECSELRASLTEAQARATEAEAEIARLKADRDSWRRCADTRESERLELRCSFLDFVAYVRGESPSLLTDECVDAWRVIELESRLKSDGAQ